MACIGDGADLLKCSFCGKSQKQVKKLIAGPGVYICDECIELCNEIIEEELTESVETGLAELPKPRTIFDFLSQRNKNTASVAKDRLRILIQQERSLRGAPDYLPLLQRELLEVIRKYVNVDAEAVKVDLIKDGDNEVLDISVALPEKSANPA